MTLTCVAGSDKNCPGRVCSGGICVDPNADLAAPLRTFSGPTGPRAGGGLPTGTGYPVGEAVACGLVQGRRSADSMRNGYAPCVSAPLARLLGLQEASGLFIANVVGRYPIANNLAAVVCTGNDFTASYSGAAIPSPAAPLPPPAVPFTQFIDCEDRSSDFRVRSVPLRASPTSATRFRSTVSCAVIFKTGLGQPVRRSPSA